MKKTAVKFLEKVFFTYAEPYAGFSEKEKWVISESDFMELIDQAKEMEKAEKIKAQIDILKLAHLRLSVEGIDKFDDTMVFTVNELEQQLKLKEDE